MYKEQLAISEETVENLTARVKRLLEENRGLKAGSTASATKVCREYEDKVFECESKIFALERKISNLELERTKTENERAVLQKNVNSVQNELSTLKAATQKQTQTREEASKDLEGQVAILEQ
jgi:chromosome segregation ATPase